MRSVVTSAVGDTLCDIQTPYVPWAYRYSTVSGSGTRRMEYIGNPELLFFPDRGILMSTGIEPVLTWFNTDGEVIERILLDLEPAPVTSEEQEQIRQAAQEEYERRKEQQPDRARAALNALRIPAQKSFWEAVFLDDSSFYWLRVAERMVTALDMSSGPLFLILSPAGEYLGYSRQPIWTGTCRKGLLMGRIEDEETGVFTTTIYRIIPILQGLRYP